MGYTKGQREDTFGIFHALDDSLGYSQRPFGPALRWLLGRALRRGRRRRERRRRRSSAVDLETTSGPDLKSAILFL